MKGHKDTIQSVSEGDEFHFYDPAMEKWIETEVENVDEYCSSYSADQVHFQDEMIDGSSLKGILSKSKFKEQIRDPGKRMHTGSLEECSLSHNSDSSTKPTAEDDS